MYNEKHYNKALEVIKSCSDYAKTMFKDIIGNDDFDSNHKIIYLETQRIGLRGECALFLSLSYMSGLGVCGRCDDGHVVTKKIGSHPKPDPYAYNNQHQKTIDLAVSLCKHWDTIKVEMQRIREEYITNHDQTMTLLNNFQV